MNSSGAISEIVEAKEDMDLVHHFKGSNKLSIKVKAEEKESKSQDYHAVDDLNLLIKAIDLRTSYRVSGSSHQMATDMLCKNALKKPVKVGETQATLKQALRKLCVSQASEMAAMKRLSKPSGLSNISEAGSIKRPLASGVVPSGESEEKGNLVEISLKDLSGNSCETRKISILKSSHQPSAPSPIAKVQKTRIQDVMASTETAENSSVPAKKKVKVKLISKNTALNFKRGVESSKTKIKDKDSAVNKPDATPVNCKSGVNAITREKGESWQSWKSSMGDYSSSTSISDESHESCSGNGSRPHMSKDVRWEAIRGVAVQHGSLGLKNFRLLKRLGCGDIGTVYLAELTGWDCMFALKVMDVEFLVSRKKMSRVQTEREILQMLDHPFLPTLYANFTTDNLSCLVMEYCPGGDLHFLRQRQPGRSFPEAAARFYVAEVLLALEYLHMLGVVYRDLKPENILVREDGHIMLTDFDLSLRCNVVMPTLFRSQQPIKRPAGPCPQNNCIEPIVCLQPSCFAPAKAQKIRSEVSPLPQLVVEPTEARSNSFVGTHEYLAPEIIKGDGHGSVVDWWTFGIFLYELLYGRTPFKGPGNDETLVNVVSQSLKFPDSPSVSFEARELMGALLVKEPENRLGSVRGAAEIKRHPFFQGMNWALIRCAAPPEIPRSYDVGAGKKKEGGKCLDFKIAGDGLEFQLF